MHGEHAVEDLGRNKVVERADELDAHDGGFQTAKDQHQQSVEKIEYAEALVVDGGDPGVQRFNEGLRVDFSGGFKTIESVDMVCSMRSQCSLMQRLQVSDDGVEFVLAQSHGGHERAGLDGVGKFDPAAWRFSGVLEAAPAAMVSRLIR